MAPVDGQRRGRHGGAPPGTRPRQETAPSTHLGTVPFAATAGAGDVAGLETFLELGSEMFVAFDPDGRFVWWNEGFARALGYGADELSAFTASQLVHPDDLAAAEAATEDVRRGTPARCVATRFRARSGEWRSWEWNAEYDPASGLVYAVARDRTRQRAAEDEVRAVRAELQDIIDHSVAPIFVKDLAGRYLMVNDAFLRPLGLQRRDVVGRTPWEIWPEYPVAADAADRRVAASGATETTEDVVELADGPHTILTTRFAVRDEVGAIWATAGIATDITDRIRAEQERREHERVFDTITRASPDVVTLLGPDGAIVEMTDASAAIVGQVHDVTSSQLATLVHPDDAPEVLRTFGALLSGELGTAEVRYRVRGVGGQWVTYDSRARAVRGDDGGITGAIVVSRDVTDELEVEQQLRDAVEATERASRAKSEFLSRMSHELRTPLNSVLGFAQLLQLDALPERQAEAVGHILRAGRHLLNLIDEVLDIARIETGHVELSLEPVDVGAVVADAVSLTRPIAGRRGVSLEVVAGLAPAAPTVRADRQRLLQVLLNLLSNAVKYNRPGGWVHLQVSAADERTVALSVSDSGQGIPEDRLARVFEPFDRLGAEHSGVEGTGVGLTLTKHLVERMSGTISVTSVVGQGTTFEVRLPAAPAPAPAPPPAGCDGSQPAAPSHLRVLHVEDNLTNLKLVEQVLTRRGGIELMAAMQGSLGLELAREHRPDLVLLDLHLPDMHGTEVIRLLRADPRTADVNVVVVSADATAARDLRLRSLGVAGVLTKPIDVRELLRVVDGTDPSSEAG